VSERPEGTGLLWILGGLLLCLGVAWVLFPHPQRFALNANCDREVELTPTDAGYAVTVMASNDTPQQAAWIEAADGVEMRWTGARQVVIAVPPAIAIKDVRPRVSDVDVSVVRTPSTAAGRPETERPIEPAHKGNRVCIMAH
jgi:hypothetical protein